jgi:hypothetical protein
MKKCTTKVTVSRFVSEQLKHIKKTQREIIGEMGLENANVISMIGGGKLKLPIKRVAALAKAIEIDPVHLLRLVLSEYHPDVLFAIEDILKHPLLSANERALIDNFRNATGDRDISSVVLELDGVYEILVLR